MDIKKTFWERVKMNWQAVWRWVKEYRQAVWRWVKEYRQVIFYLVLIGAAVAIVVFWAMYFVAVVDDWVKCKTTELICLRSRWEAIKDISLGIIIMIFGFLSLTLAFRYMVRIENSSVRNMRIVFHKELEASWQVVERGLVVGFLFLIGAVGLGLFALIIAVLFDACIECWAKVVLGISDDIKKKDVIEFIGWGIAGVLAFFGAIAINKRANAEFENNKLIEKGHIQERFKAAAEHLGKEHEGGHVAAFYEFYHLALDNDNLRKSILDILCAHLRQVTTSDKYKPKIEFIANGENLDIINEKKKSKSIEPTEEVRSLLDILFQPKGSQEESVLAGFPANLRGVFLVSVDLTIAYLEGANLSDADFRGAKLHSTKMQGTNLCRVDFRKAEFFDTNLEGMWSVNARFQEASFYNVNFRKADLWGADFYGVDLKDSDFYGADLQGADLRGADLRGADLRGVKNLKTAKLSRAKVKGAIPPERFQWPDDVDYD